LPDFLVRNEGALRRETETIRTWFESGHAYYHIYKMNRSDQFAAMGGQVALLADAPESEQRAASWAARG
jgi:isoleucyl-tRNA synthetase